MLCRALRAELSMDELPPLWDMRILEMAPFVLILNVTTACARRAARTAGSMVVWSQVWRTLLRTASTYHGYREPKSPPPGPTVETPGVPPGDCEGPVGRAHV